MRNKASAETLRTEEKRVNKKSPVRHLLTGDWLLKLIVYLYFTDYFLISLTVRRVLPSFFTLRM